MLRVYLSSNDYSFMLDKLLYDQQPPWLLVRPIKVIAWKRNAEKNNKTHPMNSTCHFMADVLLLPVFSISIRFRSAFRVGAKPHGIALR